MIKSSIEKLAEDIGFDIGNSDDYTQSKLINGLCRGLNNSMNESSLDTQICYIVDKLSKDSLVIMTKIYSFIEYKNKGI